MAKSSDTPLVIIIPSVATITFFSVFLLIKYIKFRPYLYPEKQAGIWVFRAKCTDISTFGVSGGTDMHDHGESYHAHFQKGGGHICIDLTAWEYKSNPKGQEYIFYKFNDKTGNRWAAIAANKLDEL